MPGPAGVKHIFAIGLLTDVQIGEGMFWMKKAVVVEWCGYGVALMIESPHID